MSTLASYKDGFSETCRVLKWVEDQFGGVAYAVVSALACQRLVLMAAGRWKVPEAGDWDAELAEVARVFGDGGGAADLADFEKRWFGGEAALALVSADTDRVKEYVFESAKIPEVRGASALLQDLNEQDTAKELSEGFGIPRKWIIYAGGGSFLIVTAAELADQIVSEITAFYPATTFTATITAVSWPVPLPELRADLGRHIRELGLRLKVAKLQKKAIPYFDTLPHGEFCAVCDIRPAQKRYRDTPDLLCVSCARKRNHSDRKRMLKEFDDFLDNELDLRTGYYGEPVPKTVGWAETLADIGKLGNGYVGAILADGDDIGRIVRSLQTLQEFHEFAYKLEETIRQAVFRSLAIHLHCHPLTPARERRTHFHPFELIAAGGDDLFLIVPAPVAFRVGMGIMKKFAKAKPAILPPRLQDRHWGMSAGILICPDHFPIYFMRGMADQLLARAKQETRRDIYAQQHAPSEQRQESESHVDFLILKGAATPRRQLKELMLVLYEPGQHGDIRLTERPYSRSRFQELLDLAGQLKDAGLSRTQVQAMADAFYRGREQATLEILYRISRLDQSPRSVLDLFIEQTLQAEGALFPWKEHPGARPPYRTAFLDLLELYEFAWPPQGEEDDGDAS
jgi:hypothetical protein